MNETNLCGCGKPVRYFVRKDEDFTESCNKYFRCPTYDELATSHQTLVTIVNAYARKHSVDGLNGRKWDASKHYEAEAQVEQLKESIKKYLYPDIREQL